MYNGIGLLSVRGSGTSGYVQTNKFNLRGPPQQSLRDRDEAGPAVKKPNQEILEHNRKREVELEVETMRAQLEDEGLPEDEIEEKLAAYRTQLLAKLAELGAQARDKLAQETHEVARRKQEQMERLRGAFGFAEEVREGEAFNRELQEERRQAAIAEREAKEKERRKRIEKAKKDAKKREKEVKRAEKKRKRAEEKERKRLEKERKAEEKRFKLGKGYYRAEVEAPERYQPAGASEDEQEPEPAAPAPAPAAHKAQQPELLRPQQEPQPLPLFQHLPLFRQQRLEQQQEQRQHQQQQRQEQEQEQRPFWQKPRLSAAAAGAGTG